MTKVSRGSKSPRPAAADAPSASEPPPPVSSRGGGWKKGWAPRLATVREALGKASDVVDRAVRLDTRGPKPITLGPVGDGAFAAMEAKVAQLEAPTALDAKTRGRLERGEIISTSRARPDGTVEERTIGVVNVPLERFLERVPARDWGKHLVDYMGGEVRPAGPNRQIERMVLRMPGKDLDMTKVETITEERDAVGRLQATRVRWEVLKSDNGTVKQDTGSLAFERFGDKTLVTWHSAHALEKFPTVTTLVGKKTSDKVVGLVLSDYFTRAIEHYRTVATR